MSRITEQEVIDLLIEQNQRLMQIIEMFASKDINVVVNSYNGSTAKADSLSTSETNDNSNGSSVQLGDNNTI